MPEVYRPIPVKSTAVAPLPGGTYAKKEEAKAEYAMWHWVEEEEEDTFQRSSQQGASNKSGVVSSSDKRSSQLPPLQLNMINVTFSDALRALTKLKKEQSNIFERMEDADIQANPAEQARLNEEFILKEQQAQEAAKYLMQGDYALAKHAAERSLDTVRETEEKAQAVYWSEAEKRSAFAASRGAQTPNPFAAGVAQNKSKIPKALEEYLAATKDDIEWYQHMRHLPEAREYWLVSSRKLEGLEDLIATRRIAEAEELAKLDYREYQAKHFDRNPMNRVRLDAIKAGGVIHPAPSVEDLKKYLPSSAPVDAEKRISLKRTEPFQA